MSDTLLGETLKGMNVSDDEISAVLIAQASASANTTACKNAMPDIQPGNLATVELFFVVGKYWERAGMEAIQLCLDPVKVECRANKLVWYKTLTPLLQERLWDGLDIMENACLNAWAEHRKTNE